MKTCNVETPRVSHLDGQVDVLMLEHDLRRDAIENSKRRTPQQLMVREKAGMTRGIFPRV